MGLLCNPRILCPWDFPGKNPGVGCLSLLQEIFPMQGSNPCLPHLHWQAESLMLCHPESPLQAWVPAQAGVLPVDQGNPTRETDAVWTVRVICSISSDLGDRSGGQVNSCQRPKGAHQLTNAELVRLVIQQPPRHPDGGEVAPCHGLPALCSRVNAPAAVRCLT